MRVLVMSAGYAPRHRGPWLEDTGIAYISRARCRWEGGYLHRFCPFHWPRAYTDWAEHRSDR